MVVNEIYFLVHQNTNNDLEYPIRLTVLAIYFEQLLQFSQCTGWVGSGQRSVKNIYFYVSYNVLVWWVSNLDIL